MQIVSASNNFNEGVSYNYTTLLSFFSRILMIIITNAIVDALRVGQYLEYILFNVILNINKIMKKCKVLSKDSE